MEKLQKNLRLIRIWIISAVLGFGIILIALIGVVPVDEKVSANGIIVSEEER